MQSAQPGPELHYSFEVDYKYVKSRPYKCWFCVLYFQLSQKYILIKIFHDKKCNATGRYKRELKDK